MGIIKADIKWANYLHDIRILSLTKTIKMLIIY